mgnify:FL=1
MKIAFISCSSGIVYRGVETFVHELANGLAKNNTVVVYQGGPELTGTKYKTVQVKIDASWSKENGLRSLSKSLLRDFSLSNFIRRFYLDYWNRKQGEFTLKALKLMEKDTDIVVIAGSGWVSLFCRIWTWLNHKKLIIAGQSGPGWDDRISLWCRPDVFVALSRHAAVWAKEAGFGVPVSVIHNGVNLNTYRPEILPAKINLPRPLFVCVAALEPAKRVDLTIKAVGKLKSGSLLVMGDGQSKSSLEKLAGDLLPGRFQTRYVKPEEMPSFYSAADCVTMAPFGYESFGIVFVEAMACNKPVVASDDPIRREIVGDAGILVDPENTGEYAGALQKALDKDWGDIPRKQAEKFSWDNIAKQYDELFKRILDRGQNDV